MDKQIVVYEGEKDVRLEVKTDGESNARCANFLEGNARSLRSTSTTSSKRENWNVKWYVQNLHIPLPMVPLRERHRFKR